MHTARELRRAMRRYVSILKETYLAMRKAKVRERGSCGRLKDHDSKEKLDLKPMWKIVKNLSMS